MCPIYYASRVNSMGLIKNRVSDAECGVCLLTFLPLPFSITICILDKLHILASTNLWCKYV